MNGPAMRIRNSVVRGGKQLFARQSRRNGSSSVLVTPYQRGASGSRSTLFGGLVAAGTLVTQSNVHAEGKETDDSGVDPFSGMGLFPQSEKIDEGTLQVIMCKFPLL